MLDFYDFGEMLLKTLTSVGSFVTSTPFDFISSIYNDLSDLPFVGALLGTFPLLDPSLVSSDYTIASFILGSGLTFVIGWRFVKFFTDIVL